MQLGFSFEGKKVHIFPNKTVASCRGTGGRKCSKCAEDAIWRKTFEVRWVVINPERGRNKAHNES